MISMKLELDGLFAPGRLKTWERLLKADIHQAVGRGMQQGSKPVVQQLRGRFATAVRISKRTAVNTWSAKLFDKKKSELPALWIGSRAAFAYAHAYGARIPGPVLIPLLEEGKRMGRKAFARLVDSLMRAGNAEFRNVNGKVILFAESNVENSRALSRFRRAERVRRGGTLRKPKGRALELPIAVLVRDVDVPKSFPFEALVRGSLPDITLAIQRELDRA